MSQFVGMCNAAFQQSRRRSLQPTPIFLQQLNHLADCFCGAAKREPNELMASFAVEIHARGERDARAVQNALAQGDATGAHLGHVRVDIERPPGAAELRESSLRDQVQGLGYRV